MPSRSCYLRVGSIIIAAPTSSTLLCLILLTCQLLLAFPATVNAQKLASDEVEALRVIGTKLKKTSWNFSVDPCIGTSPWFTSTDDAVTCNCSLVPNSTVCHVVTISLKKQSLQGTLPPEFVKLPYLQILDLTRNYLNGTLPPEWGAFQNIINITLLGNRLTGPIPKEFGNMFTILTLHVESNNLSGPLPPELGNLTRIQRLLLTSNNFNGSLPPSFANLSALQDIRLGDNQFTARIPDLIGNWTSLTKLIIQGSGFQGPIPSTIRALQKLNDLRISDLTGTEADFPDLGAATSIKTLILRNCNLKGTLPSYVGELSDLKNFDVSFNKLTGEIPAGLISVNPDYLYLTANQFNSTVPALKRGDISFNNFTGSSTVCLRGSLNLFEATPAVNRLGIASCLGVTQCPQQRYNLYINCGGEAVVVEAKTYMEDKYQGSYYEKKESSWVYSSTGNWMDDDNDNEVYVTSNTSALSVLNPQLYKTARLAPTSLTYYAYCLMTGNYTVSLHFAEIMFTSDRNYSSLGRRVFNVFVQGKLVLSDFNIEDSAGGAGKATIQNFTARVTNGTLHIRLYWAGKGTTAIPDRGVYGPLISAITVLPYDFNPPIPKDNSLSGGAVAGIVIGVVCFIFLILVILWWRGCFSRKDTTDAELRGLDLQTGSFSLRQIKAATSNFSPDNKIGEGGFGSVYKGLLSDGTIIAVKQLSAKSKQGNREFVNEIGMISALQHPHLVKLYGCCVEGSQLLLVYEYLENNSLARALFGPKEFQLHLDWKTRHRICVGIARGLAYLHEESRLKIVHRDIKATNVLLDKDLNSKISDFGLAKLDEEDNTHISTRIAGTFGYMAPEYAMRGYLTDKADVYSFGIVALEIVSGQANSSYRSKEESFYLLDWAHILKERGNLMELVDPRLGKEFDKEEAMAMIHVALLCTHVSPAIRPSMSGVVSMLEGKANVPVSIPEDKLSHDDTKLEAMRRHFRGIEGGEAESLNKEVVTGEKGVHHTMSIDVPWTGSTASASDLYPMLLDTEYWQNRE